MADVTYFQKFREDSKKVNEAISLDAWINSFRSEEEMREVFLNMDRAMKYVHEHGYCIKTFDPKEIEILNNSVNQIKFNRLLEMPNDQILKNEIIKEDIYNSSFIQIGIYTKCLMYLQPEFLKENFDKIATFLPIGDVPYYRGVVQRGASVYFCEYAVEKRKRDLTALEGELDDSGLGRGRQLVKSNGQSVYDDTSVNDTINDFIYKQISTKKDAAFIGFLIYPTIILILGIILAAVAFILSII